MNKKTRVNSLKLGIYTLLGTSLVTSSLAIFSQATAQTTSLPNPCPGIYYKEPFNSNFLVPEGCPPNEATRRLGGVEVPATVPETEITPGSTTQTVPPLPEESGPVLAVVEPIGGKVSVQLINSTNTAITYEVTGHTAPRSLPGRTEILLQDLPLPVSITTVRPDRGLVDIAATSSRSGWLEVVLQEDPSLDDTQGVLVINASGQVLVD